MTRAFNPRLSIEMAIYTKSSNGSWVHEAGAERAFGFCGETNDPTKYEHWWLMSSGLIQPQNMSASRKVVIKALDNPAFGPTDPGSTSAGWIAQQRANWAILKEQDPSRSLEWIQSNVWTFDSRPALTTLPPYPGGGSRKKQIDDGSMGVFLGLDESTATHLGELYVSGTGSTRSEIWVLAQAYNNHIPPGSDGGDPQHWITLGPTRTFASRAAEGPQDFLDRAWSGIANPGGVVLSSASIYPEIQ